MNTKCSTDSRKLPPLGVIVENEGRSGTAHVEKRRALARRSRRLDRVSIGFWLGGATFGIGGCILGAHMPYHHPVAVASSMSWWGIYLGCFGATVGALFGLFTDRPPIEADNLASSM